MHDNLLGHTAVVHTDKTRRWVPLACPKCGGENLHHEVVVVYDREEDATLVTKIVVGKGDVSKREVKSEGSGNPSARRDGMSIGFICETCPAWPELTVEQHKGSTYLAWRNVGSE
jgi:hypothetical protein